MFDSFPQDIPDEVDSALVMFHGYGADGNDLLLPLTENWRAHLPTTAFIAPNGYIKKPIFGYEWFRLTDINEQEITEGAKNLEQDNKKLLATIQKTLALPADKIVLLGFSQGTIIALDLALHYDERVAGVVGFSGALARRTTIQDTIKQKPPVLLIHGALDNVVPPMATPAARESLAEAGVVVESLVEDNIGHGMGPQGMEKALVFIKKSLFI